MMKMLRLKNKSSFLILFVLFISCKADDQFTARKYPRVNTLQVSDISDKGVTFNGEIFHINSSSEIIDHGFIFSRSRYMSGKTYKISLGTKSEIGRFHFDEYRGQIKDDSVYVSAYVESEGYEVIGEVVAYKSQGGIKPVINRISPLKGYPKDTVVIHGNYFSANPSWIIVSFDNVASSVLSSTDSTITCVLPIKGINPYPIVSVSVAEVNATEADLINFPIPRVNGFSPTQGYSGDVITISGTFRTDREHTVFFNQLKSEVISFSETEIRVKVPAGADQKSSIIINIEKEGRVYVNNPFTNLGAI